MLNFVSDLYQPIPHVGCKSHQFGLDVNHYIDSWSLGSNVIEEVQKTMKGVKAKLKDAALLRRFTDLKPALPNATRWSGKKEMTRKFLRLHLDLLNAKEHGATFTMDETTSFKEKVEKVDNILSEFDLVTKHLQTAKLTLLDCRASLDFLEKLIIKKRTDPHHHLYSCSFKLRKASVFSPLAPDVDFERAVVKIQSGNEADLSEAEKMEVSGLLVSNQEFCGVDSEETDEEEEEVEEESCPAVASPQCMKDFLSRPVEHAKPTQRYINCDFVLGSCAEVERLWSIAGNILTDNRKSMAPQLFEAILFLRMNKRLWGDDMVLKAVHIAKEKGAEARAMRACELQEEDISLN